MSLNAISYVAETGAAKGFPLLVSLETELEPEAKHADDYMVRLFVCCTVYCIKLTHFIVHKLVVVIK